MPTRSSGRLPAVAFLFFLSGAAGLVYQVVWSRLLNEVFGVTAHAVTAVLATYLGGLSLGGWLLGRVADRRRSALAFYGLLELGIAGAALAGTLVVRHFDPIHIWAANRLAPDSVALLAVRVALASVVIVPPTVLMGATLPAITRVFVDHIGRLGRQLAFVYALNTCGAVLGSFLAGFVLIRAFGVHPTLWLAAAVNVAVGAAALWLARGIEDATPVDAAPMDAVAPASAPPAAAPALADGGAWVLAAIGLSGVASLALEVLWTRVLILALGTSTYAFATMLTAFLVGIALGSFLVRAFIDRLRDPRRAFGWVQVGIAASTLATIPLLGWIGGAAAGWTGPLEVRPIALGAERFGIAFLVMVVPTTLIGTTFPLAARVWARKLSSLGGSLGQLYAANTLGNIVGAAAGGFVVLPLLGMQRGIALMAGVSLVCAAGALLPLGKQLLRPAALLRAAPVPLGLWGCALLLSLWRPAPFPGTGGSDEDLVRYYREGLVSTVKVIQSAQDARQLLMAVDGITIGQSGGGVERKQQVLAHLPFLLEPGRGPADVLSIGLGTGILIGEVAKHPGVESVECVELSSSVIEGARLFTASNGNVLDNPRVRVVNDDGVMYLRRSSRRWDAIISDGKSRSGHAGNALFYSEDYYRAAREHLADAGTMVQWVPLDVPVEDLKVIVRTFEEVFPHSYLLLGHESAYLVGRQRPLVVDVPHVQRVLDAPETAALRRFGWTDAHEVASLVLADGPAMARWLAGDDTVNSLERPVLEFYALSGFAATDAERFTENFAELASLRHAGLTDVARVGADPARLAAADTAAERLLPALVAFRRGEPDGLSRVSAAAADARPDGILGQLAGATIFAGAYDVDRGGDLARAAEGYAAAVALYPSLPEAWTNLGRARAAVGQLAEATMHLRRAVELNPDQRNAHAVLSQLLAASGDRAGAAEHARAAARIAPASADAHEGAGQALAAAGDADAALAEFRAALAVRPTWATAMDQIALLLSLRPGAAERREALELARRASEVEPKNPTTLEVLAAVYAAEGDVTDALAAQRKAVDLAAEAGNEPLLAQEREELRRYEQSGMQSPPGDARRL